MRKSKKFIILAVLLVAVIAGTIGGVALAQPPDGEDGGDYGPNHAAMLEKVAEIYETNTGTPLDVNALQEAFTAAREEIATQQREEREQRLIEEGIITQEQLDEFKAWLDARPDEMMSDEFQEWLENRPDIGIGPGYRNGEGNWRGPGGRGGFGGPGGGFGGPGGGFHGAFQSGNDL